MPPFMNTELPRSGWSVLLVHRLRAPLRLGERRDFPLRALFVGDGGIDLVQLALSVLGGPGLRGPLLRQALVHQRAIFSRRREPARLLVRGFELQGLEAELVGELEVR